MHEQEAYLAQLLELCAGHVSVNVLRALSGGSDERKVDGGLSEGGELHLRLLGGLSEALQSLLILTEIDVLGLLEILREVVHDALVEVVATEVGVTAGGEHLENTITHLQHRHVEGATTEIKNQDRLVTLPLKAIGEGSGGGLVDDAQDFDTSDTAGVLGCLALRVVEVSGHSDNCLLHFRVQESRGIAGELAQNLCGDLLSREIPGESRALDLHVSAVVGGNLSHKREQG